MRLSRIAAGLLTAACMGAGAGAVETGQPARARLVCDGMLAQGGLAVCVVEGGEGYRIEAEGAGVALSPNGAALLAFDRDADKPATVRATGPGEPVAPLTLAIAKRDWRIERIDGLPPSKVAPRTQEEQKKVEEDWVKKQAVWAAPGDGAEWLEGFASPIAAPFRRSGVFGSQRILNGEPGRMHNGVDYAAPDGMASADFVGTPVLAPAAGVVQLAAPDMYFEGGLVVLEHGGGARSVFLHLDSIDVAAGQPVAKGDKLGGVGSTGRSTGPHLHWSLRVGGARDAVYIDPESALAFDPRASAALSEALAGAGGAGSR